MGIAVVTRANRFNSFSTALSLLSRVSAKLHVDQVVRLPSYRLVSAVFFNPNRMVSHVTVY